MDILCDNGTWATLGKRKDREWLGWGETGRHFGSEVSFAH
jgi:hypothetical protein